MFALLGNLLFLYVVTGIGLAKSLGDQANLTYSDNQQSESKMLVPRSNLLFVVCGLTTIMSGCYYGPPILISPESASGIKCGAKTGLSTVMCGSLFLISLFFCPIFEHVPASGTSPLLVRV